ncbi:maltotransferase domain-containing protein, partial [Streptomyces sp. NPDC007084]|uniref:maltotransferase domain-containing protein n=1 Tax=Streptomyces sp. NPDC007084 TaxID=3154313 RepID=UPI003455F98B
MPATHHSSPPPTTTSETPRKRKTESRSRTERKPVAASEAAAPTPTPTPAPAPDDAVTPIGPETSAPDTAAPGDAVTDTAVPARASAPRKARAADPAPGTPGKPVKPAKPAKKKARSTVPATRVGDSPVIAPPAPATAVGRIPVLDVQPVVLGGRRPAKAVVGEEFEVSATVFREGHDAVAANVVLYDPKGRPGPWSPMRELAPGTDRWGARVSADREGRWTYTVEAWSDPVTTWRHHAGIKIPAGQDTELVLEKGARLYERAAAGIPKGTKGKRARDTVLAAVDALRDPDRPVATRLAAALTPEVDEVLARYPLRDLVTASEPLPLLVERERALYGSWYEFFPRSESGQLDPP